MRNSSPWLAKCSNCSSEIFEKAPRQDILEEQSKKAAKQPQGRQLVASESGYGYETSICPEGVPVEFALLLLLAAFGVAFGVLYRALTLTTGKRKKRAGYLVFDSPLADLFWSGQSIALLNHPGSLFIAVFDNLWPLMVFNYVQKQDMSQRKISSILTVKGHESADDEPIWSVGESTDSCKVPGSSPLPGQ